MSDTIKKGQRVKAKTVRGDKYEAGTVQKVEQTAKGAFYSIKTDSGREFKTRAACIKPA